MKNWKSQVLLFVVCLSSVFAVSAKAAFSPIEAAKLSPFVRSELGRKDSVPVIVLMKNQANLSAIESARLPRNERLKAVYSALSQLAQTDQVEIVKLLDARKMKYRRFYIGNMIAVFGAKEPLIKEIAARPDVAKVFANPNVKMSRPSRDALRRTALESPYTASLSDVGDNIEFTKAPDVWRKYGKAGEGIVVAGQDSGVDYRHPALVNQYRGKTTAGFNHSFSWHDAVHKITAMNSSGNRCGYDLTTPCDDGDHGSHTMGTVVGSDGGQNQIGMAPKAQWIACRNMDDGEGTPASYIECFEWFLAPYASGKNPMLDGNATLAPHIINNSWGCPKSEGCTGDEFIPALKALKAAGVLVVVSAGNEGPGCGTIEDAPAWHSDLTLTVGAYDHRAERIASFSSRGPSKLDGGIGPDLVAPGVTIRSSISDGWYESENWSGTSMAGPHVAGAAALLWSIRPELIGDIDRTVAILKNSATPKKIGKDCGLPKGAIPNNTYGMGILDIAKAVETRTH